MSSPHDDTQPKGMVIPARLERPFLEPEDSASTGDRTPTVAHKQSVRLETGHGQHALTKMIAPILAILATVAMMQLISAEASPSGFLYRLFRPDAAGFDRLVPLSITLLFFWTVIDLLLKWLRIVSDRRKLNQPAISDLPLTVTKEGIIAAKDSLGSLSRADRRRSAIGRLLTLLELLASSGNLRRAHDTFRYQADLAAEASVANYSTARVFIWAMPILGFVGTVLGIGLAVGEFSGFLTGDIDNVDLVKGELSKIASGLSYSFDTTTLGLLACLPSMLLMSFVQKAEDVLSSKLETLGLAIISSFPDTPVSTMPAEGLNEPLLQRIGTGLSALEQRCSGLLESLVSLDRSSASLAGVIDGAIGSQDALKTGLELAFESLDTVRPSIDEAGECFSKSTKHLTEGVNRLAEHIDHLAYENRDVEALGNLVQRLGDQIGGIEQMQAESVTVVSRMRESFESVALRLERLETDGEGTKAMGLLLERLAEQIIEIEKLQKDSIEVVSQLKEPFEFRLVPMLPAQT